MGEKRTRTFCKSRKMEDAEIREILCGGVAHIEAPDSLKQKIDRQISAELMKEEKRMKHFSVKKVVIGVAAASLVVGAVCIAGSGVRYIMGGSSAFPNYTEFSDLEKAEADAGYEVKAVEKFANGYAFRDITIGDESVVNEAGQEESSQKTIHIGYEKDGESITLYIRGVYPQETGEAQQEPQYDRTLQVGEVQVGFHKIMNKFVPPDYELTQEDEKNMENPNFNLAYGSSEVELNTGFSTLWEENGISYDLYGTDLSISGEEMLQMAKEIIESGH